MLILSFDTSTAQGGASVLENDQILSRMIWSREGSHGELLTPSLETCLTNAGKKASDISALAVGIGPGSFTGVRISVNAARALAYSLGKLVYAFDTSEILAASVARTDLPLVTMINAHKNLIYSSYFKWSSSTKSWERTRALEAISLEKIESEIQTPHLCIGDAFAEYEKVFSPTLVGNLVRDVSLSDDPLPEVLGLMAWKASQQSPSSHSPLGWKDVHALYIRASSAEEKLRESRDN